MSLVDRQYVSRFGAATFAIGVHRGGVPGDADNSEVVVKMYGYDGSGRLSVPEWTRTADRTEVGVYAVSLNSTDTSISGPYALVYEYTIDSTPEIYETEIEVGGSAPAYDALPDGWKVVIENTWVKFADLWDSALGGPHLQVYLTTNFGRNRLAQLLRDAVGRLNSYSMPHKAYYVDANFPFSEWGYLAQKSLYIEVVKHLVRSYTEQPEAVLGTTISRLDRRDYMNRWQAILDMEAREFETELSRFKQSNLGLGNFSVLVAGGAYGNFGPVANPGGAGEAAARGYYFVGRYH